MDPKEQVERARNIRRAAKGKVTRCMKTVNVLIEAERPVQEVKDALKELKDAYAALVIKHEDYTMFLNDEEYNDAEIWLNQCSSEYTEVCIVANDYVSKWTSSQMEVEVNAASINSETNDPPSPQESIDQAPPPLNTASIQTLTTEQPVDQPLNDNVNVPPSEPVSTENTDNLGSSPAMIPSKSFHVKHEKPKLPMFYGDVRKYFIFKSDFQHAIESNCSERDAITVLRSCLGPEPAKLVEGITTDLKAAWKYLDRNYGNPRVISDTITADLEKFKTLQPGDDHRFCDLVNLVRKSFNILKEVKRPQDMDNTHIISLIERKMTPDDLKVWSRHIYVQNMEPSLANLLKWMEEEMTVRMRSGATIRKGTESRRQGVHAVGVGNGSPFRGSNDESNVKLANPDRQKNQCYVCKEIHYVDQCPRFKALTPKERWEIVKEQKACFSCLKRSKGHTVSNCLRKKECSEKKHDGSVCKTLHHKLLQRSSPTCCYRQG